MQSRVVILGTGGTIAGLAPEGAGDLAYRAAQLGIDALVRTVPALAALPLETEQVAQLDSKDMTHAAWQALAQRTQHHLLRDDVAGTVITHGTDTMEETAYLLHRVLAPNKPVVLTGAMRPATSQQADGPRNLTDAVALAREPGAQGVLVVMNGVVHGAAHVRKAHPHRFDAFSSGDAGPIARFAEGQRNVHHLQRLRAWPAGQALGLAVLGIEPSQWPVVEIVTSHAGATGALIKALGSGGAKGIVLACTGNGTVHQALDEALRDAAWPRHAVLRATRCGEGAIREVAEADDPHGDAWPSAGSLTPAQARVELMLRLMSMPR